MKIRTRLHIIIIITIAVFASIIFLNFWWQKEADQLDEKEKLVRDLQLAIFEHAQLRDEFFMYGEERSRAQWLLMFSKTRKIFERMSGTFTSPDEKPLLSSMISLHARSGGLFDQLVRNIEGSAVNDAVSKELRERVVNQMMVISASKYLEGLRLHNVINEKVEHHHAVSRLYGNIAYGLLALLIIFFAVSILRGISRPLLRLQKGTEIIGSGDLDFRVGTDSADEIGQLSRSFDVMVQKRRDVDEQIRRSLEEKEVMLKEIHHRVKNNMQVICSLLDLQAAKASDKLVRAMLEETRNRVRSMTLIHEKLYLSEDLAHIDFKEYLTKLVDGIAKTYRRNEVVISVDMEPVIFDVNVCIPCGLIVNELVTNCMKHAFPEGRKGMVRIGINRNSEGSYVLFVADDGICMPGGLDFRNTSTLGLKLVNVLTAQIHGNIGFSLEGGTMFSITFPGTLKDNGDMKKT